MEDTVKGRLMAYLNKKKISFSEFGRQLGVSSAYVHSMKRSIPPEKVKMIQELYPDLNTNWLIYGDGEMLITADNHSTIQIGENNRAADPTIGQLLEEMAEQRKLTARSQDHLSKSQEQIDRLIGVIETMQRGS